MCLGIPGRVESIVDQSPLTRSAKVSFGGISKEVNMTYVPDAVVGDYVIVHVGFAISRVQEDEAQRIFHYLAQLGELDELE